MAENTVFNTLNAVNVNEHVEKKDTGKTSLSYLSWPYAWAEVKSRYPNAAYEIVRNESGLPYAFDPKTGYMCYTKVTIEDVTHEMWLPVMDGANNTMLDHPYEYETKYGKKRVAAASMFDINKTIMRCLTKNLAMFGLGLYIYAGEDLPVGEAVFTEEQLIQAKVDLEGLLYTGVLDNDPKAKAKASRLIQKECREYDTITACLNYCKSIANAKK